MEDYKIPLGSYTEDFFDWLVDNASGFFDVVSDSLEWLIDLLTSGLLWLHPAAFIALVAGVAFWVHRSVPLVIFALVSLLLIWNLGYWSETMETLSLVL
ncbi:MAG: choline ABC transporter permease subunit, partial [Pseudomonadota bacterium]